MNIRRIDLNLLVVFEVLMTYRSVTKTAEVLHLSQPAISQSLRRLRTLLNDPLLIRNGNTMLPTERAQSLTPLVAQSLRRVELILAPPEQFDPKTTVRTFTMRVPEYFEFVIYPRLYETLSQSAPGISFEINYMEEGVNDVELLNKETELVICLDQFLSSSEDLNRELLPMDTLTCMVGDSNPLQEILNADDYGKQRHVHDNVVRFFNLDSWFGHFEDWNPLGVEGYAAIVNLVDRSDYVATLPLLAAKQLLRFGGVRLIPTPADFPEFQMSMVWHSLYDNDLGLQWLRNTIRQVYLELQS